MKRIFFVDETLIHYAEKFAQWFQQMFGQDCFFLSRVCVLLSSVSGVVDGLFYTRLPVLSSSKIITSGWCFAIFFLIANIIDRKCRNQGIFNTHAYRNPAQRDFVIRFFRLVMLSSFVFFTFCTLFFQKYYMEWAWQSQLLSTSNQFFIVLYFYFVSSTPLPPVAGKVWSRIKESRLRGETSAVK
jgi:hypothetical protein